jgi:DNA modification methylase/predicted RNA-binding Zn-ribbon protein involved in translation (DUF1610 family)
VTEQFDLGDAAPAAVSLSEDLRSRLTGLRDVPGCPTGSDDAIVEMSAAPVHTACPNPYLREWVEEHRSTDEERPDPGPFAADSQAGKTSLVYKAHSYPTKVPPEAIMRFILHYTKPGDIVLDGFCGTGMTGVAAQMCGSAASVLRREIEQQMGKVEWGARRAVLQDLGPVATFIAAGINIPIDGEAFDRASAALLERFDKEYGWMYETECDDGRKSRIDYTVWSEAMTCPHCGSKVIFHTAAFDVESGRVRDEFDCPKCGAAVTKASLERRFATVKTLAGDTIERVELVPVQVIYRVGTDKHTKTVDAGDLDVLGRVSRLSLPDFPAAPLPIDAMVHGSRLAPKGFTHVHHLWSDRALATLAILWAWTAEADDHATRRSLRFWLEQAFWGLSWMNRYSATHFSQVNRNLSGIFYVGSLHAECSPRYNLEGSRPSTGKRQNLVKLWSRRHVSDDHVRIATASSTRLDVPDNTIDYIFVDPPFGANIPYSDLALVTEMWHGVVTAGAEEAITHSQQGKGLLDYTGLMDACFREFYRVLKPGRWMTVEFSNSSNAVWSGIQQALASAGFVVADTRVLDKEQQSFRQVTAKNAVKRDLIISVYKPHADVAERVRLSGGSEESVWAFVREHLSHIPIRDLVDGVPRVVRERHADRLYDRMVAFHVAQEIVVPMTAAEFYAGLDQRFPLRDGMYFLPAQAEDYEKLRAAAGDPDQGDLFITGESSAVAWLRRFIGDKNLAFSVIQPAFFQEVQKGIAGWDQLPDVKELLDQSFVSDDQGRYMVPDPKRSEHLEQLREAELLRLFESYGTGTGVLEQFRSEAVKAGFKRAYRDRDFDTIIKVGKRIPLEAFNDDPALMHYVRNAERLQRNSP